MDSQQFFDGLRVFWPLLLLQGVVQIFALIDLMKQHKVRNLSVPLWIVIIILTELVGPVLYFVFGKAKK